MATVRPKNQNSPSPTRNDAARSINRGRGMDSRIRAKRRAKRTAPYTTVTCPISTPTLKPTSNSARRFAGKRICNKFAAKPNP